MPATGVGRVRRGVLFEQHYVADQAGSGMGTLEQVVAEDAVLREATAERLLK